jgi:hypothetical protein
MLVRSLASGLVGAALITALHELMRRTVPHAPRMDLLGRQAIEEIFHSVGQRVPDEETLQQIALGADLVSNTAYYSLVGAGHPGRTITRGAFLGAAAGIGGVLLPGPLGLDPGASVRTPQTAIMTVGLYLVGGLAAALAYRLFGEGD